jgi:hypothetical protein
VDDGRGGITGGGSGFLRGESPSGSIAEFTDMVATLRGGGGGYISRPDEGFPKDEVDWFASGACRLRRLRTDVVNSIGF